MKKTFTKKRIFFGFITILLLTIYNISYADISVEELKKEYANEHSKFIEIDGKELRVCGGGFGIFGHGNVIPLRGQVITQYFALCGLVFNQQNAWLISAHTSASSTPCSGSS